MINLNPSQKLAARPRASGFLVLFLQAGLLALGMAPPVHAGGGTFYATVTNVTQLIGDINYANTNGGTFTINLQPNTTFDLLTLNGSDWFGEDLLPIIGTPKAVNLTIHGNGDTIQAANGATYRLIENYGSLTLDHLTLQNGYSYALDDFDNPYAYNGGAICNVGTLVISNCTLSGNAALAYVDVGGYGHDGEAGGKGGAIFNDGAVIISDSFLSNNFAGGDGVQFGGAIYNNSGTMTISHSTISGNGTALGDGGAIYNNSGTVTISHSTISDNGGGGDGSGGDGGGIYNNGTVTVENSSSITGNIAVGLGQDVYNLGTLYLDGTSTIGLLDGNSAIGLSPALSIHSWSSTAHQIVLSWSTNYTGCTLQSSTGPGSTNWTDCASPAVSGASFVVTNAMSAGAQFFRLKR
jgi:hypothetical protein